VAGCRGGAAEDPAALTGVVAAGTTRGSAKRKSKRMDNDGDGDVQHQSYSSRFNDRTERLVIGNTGTLRKSTNNPAGLVSSERPI
jgi:hypothetical protein